MDENKYKYRLVEIIDIYKPDELSSKGIKYNITRENSKSFRAELNYKDSYYLLKVLILYNVKRPNVNFGSTDENYSNLNLNELINSPYSSRILAAIFGLIRYWVDNNNVDEFEYTAEGNVRNKLYKYYLEKHFPDFENYKENMGTTTFEVWKRK